MTSLDIYAFTFIAVSGIVVLLVNAYRNGR